MFGPKLLLLKFKVNTQQGSGHLDYSGFKTTFFQTICYKYAEKTKYPVMSRDQDAGQNHNKETGNNSLERVEQVKYLGTNLTNQNSMHEEITSRLKPENACYHSAQNLLFSSLLCKNIRIETHRKTIFPLVLYGCQTGL
jgi:hypothetical protein